MHLLLEVTLFNPIYLQRMSNFLLLFLSWSERREQAHAFLQQVRNKLKKPRAQVGVLQPGAQQPRVQDGVLHPGVLQHGVLHPRVQDSVLHPGVQA